MNEEMMDSSYTLEQAIQVLLFAAKEPISAKEMAKITGSRPADILTEIEQLNKRFEEGYGPFRIEKAGDHFVLKTQSRFRPLIDQLYKGPVKEKLSKAALEVLAIVLHKEPVARSSIDQLRGVDCLPILQALMDRGLIEIETGPEKKIPLYKTTKRFYSFFSLPDKEAACSPEASSQDCLLEPNSAL